MGKASKVGAIVALAGAMIFFFGVYILPFGTDFWMYIWVEKIFHGNWLYGDIAANAAAIFLIIIGAALMLHERHNTKEEKEEEDIILVRVPKKKTTKKRKKKSEVYRL